RTALGTGRPAGGAQSGHAPAGLQTAKEKCMKFVYHVDDEPASVLIDGRLLTIPPNELFEVPEIRGTDCNNNGNFEYIIPDHAVLNRLLEHAWYHGLVEVPVIRTPSGVTTDVEAAKRQARDKLNAAHDRILTRYVSDQQERVTQHGKSAIAPGGRVLQIIEKRGIDLKRDFNIDPPGFVVEKTANRDAEIASLREENARTQKQLQELLERLNDGKTTPKARNESGQFAAKTG